MFIGHLPCQLPQHMLADGRNQHQGGDALLAIYDLHCACTLNATLMPVGGLQGLDVCLFRGQGRAVRLVRPDMYFQSLAANILKLPSVAAADAIAAEDRPATPLVQPTPLVQQAAHRSLGALHILQQDHLTQLHYSILSMRVGLRSCFGDRFQ